jgi:hypothetical protein
MPLPYVVEAVDPEPVDPEGELVAEHMQKLSTTGLPANHQS